MIYHFSLILGITERLNELNEKLNTYLSDKTDNVFIGAAVLGIILVVTFWGISELNKKN